MDPTGTECFGDVVIVGGTSKGGYPWSGADNGTDSGPYVDLSAQAPQITSTAMGYHTLDLNAGTGPNGFGWATLWQGGTSFSSPQVAGVMALVLSAYPSLSPEEVRDKVIVSTDPLNETGTDPRDGFLGTGRVNAYKALTYYGDITQFGQMTWSGTVWVSGDITIPTGATLTIEPGTTIKVAQDDIMSGGLEPERIEWFVEGNLIALGTEANPIVFEIFADDPSTEWGQFKLAASENVLLDFVEFHDLLPRDMAALDEAPAVLAPGESTTISWTTDHVQSGGATPVTYESDVRIRTSVDGGGSFDQGQVVPVGDGQYTWTAPAGSGGQSVVIRVEFLDGSSPSQWVIGFDDFELPELRVIEPIPSFANVSAASGLDIPAGSTPYASAPLDYDGDGDEDVVVSFTDRFASLNMNSQLQGDYAVFQNVGDSELGDGLVANTRGATRLDYDNDGDADLYFASATGSRLFANGYPSSALQTEVTSTLLSAIAGLPSKSAAWGDYNRDGYIDAYVVMDGNDVLLESRQAQGPNNPFLDVTAAAGLHLDAGATISAMWANVDEIGGLDLFVAWNAQPAPAGPALGWSPLYINQGNDGSGQFTFVDVAGATTGPRIEKFGFVSAADFADVNGDAELDAILCRQNVYGPDALGNLMIGINDGSGAFDFQPDALGIHVDTWVKDVEIADLDGNGVPDIIGAPSSATADVSVFMGYGDAASRKYWDASQVSGLGSGAALGILSADFNRDSDHDLLLLRPEDAAGKRFMWANPLVDATSPPPTPVTMTVGFDTNANTLNAMGLGATVSVSLTTPNGDKFFSSQVVDGGSGNGSQGSGNLAFGLAGASTAEIRVRWPHGAIQVFDAAQMPGFPNVKIKDTHNPGIIESTISATYEPGDGYVEHTFTWHTWNTGGDPQVYLSASRPTSACMLPLGGNTSILLTSSDPSVSVTSVPSQVDLGQGPEDTILHTMTWTAYCSAPCSYQYSVRHVVNGELHVASNKTMSVGVCGTITW